MQIGESSIIFFSSIGMKGLLTNDDFSLTSFLSHTNAHAPLLAAILDLGGRARILAPMHIYSLKVTTVYEEDI